MAVNAAAPKTLWTTTPEDRESPLAGLAEAAPSLELTEEEAAIRDERAREASAPFLANAPRLSHRERRRLTQEARESEPAPPHESTIQRIRDRLTVDELAFFKTPKTWDEILDGKLGPKAKVADRWRRLVLRAEVDGLLYWIRAMMDKQGSREIVLVPGKWTLTDEGRERVRLARALEGEPA